MSQLQISLIVNKPKLTDYEKTTVMYNLPSTMDYHSSFKKIQKNRRLLSLDHSYLNGQDNEPKT